MNSVCLVGRIVRDPEVKSTAGGVSVCAFSLAVPRNYKSKEGKYESDFFRCVAYRAQSDYLGRYCHKGDLLEVSGKLHQNSYEKDGTKVSAIEVIAENLKNHTPKKSGAENTATDGFDEMEPLDEVPF